MPYFGLEFHFGWLIGVLWRHLNVDLEETSLIWSILRALDVSNPMPNLIVHQGHSHCRLLALIYIIRTVLANSSNSFRIRISFFCAIKQTNYKYHFDHKLPTQIFLIILHNHEQSRPPALLEPIKRIRSRRVGLSTHLTPQPRHRIHHPCCPQGCSHLPLPPQRNFRWDIQ